MIRSERLNLDAKRNIQNILFFDFENKICFQDVAIQEMTEAVEKLDVRKSKEGDEKISVGDMDALHTNEKDKLNGGITDEDIKKYEGIFKNAKDKLAPFLSDPKHLGIKKALEDLEKEVDELTKDTNNFDRLTDLVIALKVAVESASKAKEEPKAEDGAVGTIAGVALSEIYKQDNTLNEGKYTAILNHLKATLKNGESNDIYTYLALEENKNKKEIVLMILNNSKLLTATSLWDMFKEEAWVKDDTNINEGNIKDNLEKGIKEEDNKENGISTVDPYAFESHDDLIKGLKGKIDATLFKYLSKNKKNDQEKLATGIVLQALYNKKDNSADKTFSKDTLDLLVKDEQFEYKDYFANVAPENVIPNLELIAANMLQEKAELEDDGKIKEAIKKSSLASIVEGFLGEETLKSILKDKGVVGMIARMIFDIKLDETANLNARDDAFKLVLNNKALKNKYLDKEKGLFVKTIDNLKDEHGKKVLDKMFELTEGLYKDNDVASKNDTTTSSLIYDIAYRFSDHLVDRNTQGEFPQPFSEFNAPVIGETPGTIKIQARSPLEATAIAHFYAPAMKAGGLDLKNIFEGFKTIKSMKKDEKSANVENAKSIVNKFEKSDPYSTAKNTEGKSLPALVTATVVGSVVTLKWSNESIQDQITKAMSSIKGEKGDDEVAEKDQPTAPKEESVTEK